MEEQIQHLSGLHQGDELFSECEVVIEGEADQLDTRHKRCPKNPGHPTFIPVSDFTIRHLPQELQTQENMDFIQRKIDLTVRIRVAYTSVNRPNTFSDSKQPYPFSQYKGNRKVVRYGTGTIHRLLSPKPDKNKPCPCPLCVASGKPESNYLLITVSTATHVIYDDSEAECATFECFFDSDDRKDVKTVYGLCIDGTSTTSIAMYKSDVCEIVCVTHDSEAVNRILSVLFPNLGNVPHAFTSTIPPEGVIVSHPHGCSKRITIGKVLYLTVPIKPNYDTGTPIPLPDGTKCHFNFNRATDCPISLKESFQQKRSIPYYLRMNNQTSKGKGTHHTAGNEDPCHFKSLKFDTSENNKTRNIHVEKEGKVTSNCNEEKQDTLSKTLHQVLEDFMDKSAKLCSPEFRFMSLDRSALFTDMRKIIKQNTSFPTMNLKLWELICRHQETVTFTSKQYSGKETDVFEMDRTLTQDLIDLCSPMFGAIGFDVEMMVPFIELITENLLKMFDQTLSQNEQQSAMEDLLMKFMQQICLTCQSDSDFKTAFSKCTNVLNHSFDLDIEQAISDDDSVSDINQIAMNLVFKDIDVKTRTKLEAQHGVEWADAIFGDSQASKNSSQNKELPAEEHKLQSGLKFVLPADAEYAMRYYEDNRGWFTFPPGTQIINTLGKHVALGPGTEFRNDVFYPQHSFITYDIDTCPGSSGAAVYSNMLDNQLMTFFPHSGSSKKYNMSALHENKYYAASSNFFQGYGSAIAHFVDNIELD